MTSLTIGGKNSSLVSNLTDEMMLMHPRCVCVCVCLVIVAVFYGLKKARKKNHSLFCRFIVFMLVFLIAVLVFLQLTNVNCGIKSNKNKVDVTKKEWKILSAQHTVHNFCLHL